MQCLLGLHGISTECPLTRVSLAEHLAVPLSRTKTVRCCYLYPPPPRSHCQTTDWTLDLILFWLTDQI